MESMTGKCVTRYVVTTSWFLLFQKQIVSFVDSGQNTEVLAAYLAAGHQHPTICSGSLTLGAHAQRGLSLSVRRSVCYHVFCHYAQQGGQKAIPTGSVPHWLDFKNGDFRKSTAFKSYGVKTFSATTRNKAAKKRYQRVQCHTGLI